MSSKCEKRDFRKILVTMVIGMLPEIILAIIVGNIFEIAIWKVWLLIQGISIIISIVKESMEYFVYRFIWRYDMIDDISESLSSHEYPNPKKYPYDTLAEDYFGNVMQDDMLETSTRLDAAFTLGTISSQQGILKSLRINSGMSEAIEKYHRIKFGGKDYIEEPA